MGSAALVRGCGFFLDIIRPMVYNKHNDNDGGIRMPNTEYNTKTTTIANSNGVICMTEYIPDASEKSQAVIMSHGFNGCGDDLGEIASILAENGIYAVCYDFNGGGTRCKSSGKTTDMSVLTEQDDLRSVIAHVKSRPDTDRIYLYGESQGGFVSALTAAEYDDIAGLFLVYPAFVIPDDWLDKKESEMQGVFDFAGVPLTRKYFDGVPRYDVFAKAFEFKNPVKIWHGSADTVVASDYSLRLVKGYERAELTVFSGLGHWFPPEIRSRVAGEIVCAIKG